MSRTTRRRSDVNTLLRLARALDEKEPVLSHSCTFFVSEHVLRIAFVTPATDSYGENLFIHSGGMDPGCLEDHQIAVVPELAGCWSVDEAIDTAITGLRDGGGA